MSTVHSLYPNLVVYVHDVNRLGRFFNEKQIDMNFMTHEDKQRLLRRLECDLSPENLCCDGELRGEALAKKTSFLRKALAELLEFE